MTELLLVAGILAIQPAFAQDALFCDGFESQTMAAWSNIPNWVSSFDCSVESWSLLTGDTMMHNDLDGFLAVGSLQGDAQELPDYQLWSFNIESICIDVESLSSQELSVAIKVLAGQELSCYLGYSGFTDSSCGQPLHTSLRRAVATDVWTTSIRQVEMLPIEESVRIRVYCSASYYTGSDFLVLFDDVSIYGTPTTSSEYRVAPNMSVAGDRDPRKRGPRPLNSSR